MANIKSAKKRILVNRTKAERNKSIRSAVKTAIKKVEVAVVNTAIINKAASKGVYHKNNAARKVSRLAKAVNSLN